MDEPVEPPVTKTQDEVVGGLADLENMVADIAAELGMDDEEEAE
jgi:hypothetical protein